MFESVHRQAALMHDEVRELFWPLLTFLLPLLIVFEILKGDREGPQVGEILKRTILAIIMLMFFDHTIRIIAFMSDSMSAKFGNSNDLLELTKSFGPKESQESGGLFDLRRHMIYFLAVVSYVVSYMGYFTAIGLVNFVWAILYVLSPLMILCYIPRATASICGNLYKGLIKVSLWKVLWQILASLLLKIATSPQMNGTEDYLMAMVMNLLIGLSMLLIPLFTNSLISDGMQKAADSLASAPGLVVSKAGTLMAKQMAKKGARSSLKGVSFLSQSISKPVTGKIKVLRNKIKLNKRFKASPKIGK